MFSLWTSTFEFESSFRHFGPIAGADFSFRIRAVFQNRLERRDGIRRRGAGQWSPRRRCINLLQYTDILDTLTNMPVLPAPPLHDQAPFVVLSDWVSSVQSTLFTARFD